MRRKDLIATTMALTLTVLVAGTVTACASKEPVSAEPIATEAQTEVQTEGYTITDVQLPYTALVAKDTSIYSTEDAVTAIADITMESYVTVTGTVQFNGVDVDYYAIKTDDGTVGFMEGKDLDFDVVTENDYSDNLTEVEGGDGEETTESSTPASGVSEEATAFKSYQRYTNTNCNVRSEADKKSTLVGTLSLNTEITVIGVDKDWSKVSYNGMEAFIKSSLLSETVTEIKQSDTSNTNNTDGASSASSADTPSVIASKDSNSSEGAKWDAILEGAPLAGDMPVGGGATGCKTDGLNLGGVE
ncbi:MAG: SH3 domain-containing protein [Lachnospiraceae bacterium]